LHGALSVQSEGFFATHGLRNGLFLKSTMPKKKELRMPTTFEIDRPSNSLDLTRRDFVRTAVGTGFAASVMPVGAQTVKTDSTGLTVGEVTIMVGDFKMPAYRAAPAGKTDLPVVLVIQSYGEIGKLIAEVVGKVPDAQVMGDLDATVAWAKANGGNAAKLAITGFCWGGRITWLYTAHNPSVKAGVAWYGQLLGAPSELKPTNPIDLVAKLNAPVLGLYGAEDTGIPVAAVDQMQAALAKAGQANAAAKASQFVVYPGAPHAFHADYRPSYKKDAAEDGWKRCVAWLEANGVA